MMQKVGEFIYAELTTRNIIQKSDGTEVDILNCYLKENNVDLTSFGRHYFLSNSYTMDFGWTMKPAGYPTNLRQGFSFLNQYNYHDVMRRNICLIQSVIFEKSNIFQPYFFVFYSFFKLTTHCFHLFAISAVYWHST